MTVSGIARRAATLPTLAVFSTGIVTLCAVIVAPMANADGFGLNNRLNNGIAQSVYAIKKQAGCTTDLKNNPALS